MKEGETMNRMTRKAYVRARREKRRQRRLPIRAWRYATRRPSSEYLPIGTTFDMNSLRFATGEEITNHYKIVGYLRYIIYRRSPEYQCYQEGFGFIDHTWETVNYLAFNIRLPAERSD